MRWCFNTQIEYTSYWIVKDVLIKFNYAFQIYNAWDKVLSPEYDKPTFTDRQNLKTIALQHMQPGEHREGSLVQLEVPDDSPSVHTFRGCSIMRICFEIRVSVCKKCQLKRLNHEYVCLRYLNRLVKKSHTGVTSTYRSMLLCRQVTVKRCISKARNY